MDIKKAVMYLFLVGLFAGFVSAQHYQDYGYGSGGYGLWGSGYGDGFIAGLCTSYGDWFEFFIFFIIFFVLGHWVFSKRGSKSDLLAAVIALGLAFGLINWESRAGFSLVCGLGDIFGGLFGGFIFIILILLTIWAFFAIARGGNGAKAGVGLAYILFYFWLGSEGGYIFTDLFYFLPFDPFFVMGVMQILLIVAFIFVIVFGWKWYQEGR